MVENTRPIELEELDTSDVDRWIGSPIAGEHLRDAIAVNDIRRWVQGMNYPNRLHYDETFATESVYGRLVAPQSFAVCTTHDHGASPATQGRIPGSHMLFGGDEWWFYGPMIEPGDAIRQTRLAFDYRVVNTSFAGPTVLQRGDTNYFNHRGEAIATQRSTSIRFLVENARRLDYMKSVSKDTRWTATDLETVQRERVDYYRTFHGHVTRTFDSVASGDLPRRPIGPHTVRTFATEWRSFIFTVWGATEPDKGDLKTPDSGWLPEMSFDTEMAKIDPAAGDGLYAGFSKGHADEDGASIIAMPKSYGYGASMGAWALDYAAAWAGEFGFINHSNIRYKSPAFEGDITYVAGSVRGKRKDDRRGLLVDLDISMTNQHGGVVANGTVEVIFRR